MREKRANAREPFLGHQHIMAGQRLWAGNPGHVERDRGDCLRDYIRSPQSQTEEL